MYSRVQGTHAVLPDLSPGLSNHATNSRDRPEILLVDNARLVEVQSWCTLQFASDQLSRTRDYDTAQASLDSVWIQRQVAVDDGFALIAVRFEELLQKLEERRSMIWQQMVRTDTLSREAIEPVFLRDATGVVYDAVRAVRAAVDDFCTRVLLAIRRTENRHNRNAVADSGPPTQLFYGSEESAPPTVFVSCIRTYSDLVLIVVTLQGVRSLLKIPRTNAPLPIIAPKHTEQVSEEGVWLMGKDYDVQFSTAQIERQQDSQTRERRRQLVFDSKIQEWEERFATQLQTQRAEFSSHIPLFKRERREHMRKLCKLLSQRIDEASRWADNIVDDRLRECRAAFVDATACLEKAGLKSLGLSAFEVRLGFSDGDRHRLATLQQGRQRVIGHHILRNGV